MVSKILSRNLIRVTTNIFDHNFACIFDKRLFFQICERWWVLNASGINCYVMCYLFSNDFYQSSKNKWIQQNLSHLTKPSVVCDILILLMIQFSTFSSVIQYWAPAKAAVASWIQEGPCLDSAKNTFTEKSYYRYIRFLNKNNIDKRIVKQ